MTRFLDSPNAWITFSSTARRGVATRTFTKRKCSKMYRRPPTRPGHARVNTPSTYKLIYPVCTPATRARVPLHENKKKKKKRKYSHSIFVRVFFSFFNVNSRTLFIDQIFSLTTGVTREMRLRWKFRDLRETKLFNEFLNITRASYVQKGWTKIWNSEENS